MRRATIRTTHDDPDLVAAAVAPDNTSAMDTRVEGERVVTTIERETTGGLRSTVDDYVVNCSVAERTAAAAGSDVAGVASGVDENEQRTNQHDTEDT